MEVSQHSKYFCEFCGKYTVKRKAVEMWGCKDCGKVKARGAYTLKDQGGVGVGGSMKSEIVGGTLDSAPDKHLEKTSPSTSRGPQSNNKERLSVPSTSIGKSQLDCPSASLSENKCSDGRNSLSSTVTLKKNAAMKETLGRQKIEIKKLEKKSNKQITFSKRRAGLFNKASELSVLCGAEVAVIVFSPNEKVFCFGHPRVDAVLDRFLTGNSSPPKPAESYVPVAEFNRDFAHAARDLELEKKYAVEVMEAAKNARNNGQFWWDEPIENMGVEELKQYRSALQDLRAKVAERVEKMTAVRMGGPLIPALPSPPSFHVVGNHPIAAGLDGFEQGFF